MIINERPLTSARTIESALHSCYLFHIPLFRYWDHPWEFNPDRWIEDGGIVPPDHPKKQRLFAFGLGARQCTGEQFAKNRIFLLIVMLLQKFKLLPATGEPKPQTDPHYYEYAFAGSNMKPYKIQVQLRM